MTISEITAMRNRAEGLVIAVPRHVAIIMDGNGRWAARRRRPRNDGHRAGITNIREVIGYLSQQGVSYVTLFGFSTENWERPSDEVLFITGDLLQSALERETSALHQQNIRIIHIGRLDRLNRELQQQIEQAINLTRSNTGLTLAVAFDYGGRADIVDAARRIVADGVDANAIDEKMFARYLGSGDLPDADLVIRTGGEFRISNFLLWQSAYSEFYSTRVHWPDFGAEQAAKALDNFSRRNRRFGRVPPGSKTVHNSTQTKVDS